MMQQAGRRVLDGMRGWPSAAGDARRRMRDWGTSTGRAAWMMADRRPEIPPSRWWRGTGKPSSFRHPALLALAAAGLVLAVAGLFLYLRKRRQVAEHFNMGAGEAAREAETGGALREEELARS